MADGLLDKIISIDRLPMNNILINSCILVYANALMHAAVVLIIWKVLCGNYKKALHFWKKNPCR